MEPKKLAHAISLIAWGYLFLYFNVTLGTMNIIPNWVGYLMMGKAIKELKEASPAMDLLGPLCILLSQRKSGIFKIPPILLQNTYF